MNLPLPIAIALLLVLAVVALRAPRYLYALWPFALLAIPSVRIMVGPAPVYIYDAVTMILLAQLLASRELRRWPRGIPRWHRWFIGVGLVFGTITPAIRYGFAPEMLWILGHVALAWMAFCIGFMLYVSREGEARRTLLAYGISAAIVYGAVVGALQFGDPAMAERINAFHFRDMPDHLVRLEELGGHLSSSRVNGPHGDPNTFGGTTAIAGGICLLLLAGRKTGFVLVILALAAFTIALTVSRQVLVATVVALVVAGALARLAHQFRLAGVIAIVAVAALGSGALANWGERLGRWEGGVGQDLNVVGRVIIGPQRLIDVISREPSVLLTGVGLDVQKLVRRAKDKQEEVGDLAHGSVSNSFLIPLYFLGIAGFTLTAAFWFWVVRRAWGKPRSSRPLDMGVVTLAVLLIASDNYAFIVETTVAALFLLAAIVAGKWWTFRRPVQRRPTSRPRTWNRDAARPVSQ
jgi:hypothetical protein